VYIRVLLTYQIGRKYGCILDMASNVIGKCPHAVRKGKREEAVGARGGCGSERRLWEREEVVGARGGCESERRLREREESAGARGECGSERRLWEREEVFQHVNWLVRTEREGSRAIS
jgi:hypothetical protein